jgi:hypothetical protein
VCPLCVFLVYNKAVDSGDVVIGRRDFSIVDRHEPEFARPLSPSCHTMKHVHAHRNRICQVGRHQGARRIVPPGLYHIMSVGSHWGMSRNEKFTFPSFGSESGGHFFANNQQASKTAIYQDRYPREVKKWWKWGGYWSMYGDLMTIASLVAEVAELLETLLVNLLMQHVDFS